MYFMFPSTGPEVTIYYGYSITIKMFNQLIVVLLLKLAFGFIGKPWQGNCRIP